MTLDQAAEALGVSARGISRYRSGREAVPRTLALACVGWEALEHPHLAEVVELNPLAALNSAHA